MNIYSSDTTNSEFNETVKCQEYTNAIPRPSSKTISRSRSTMPRTNNQSMMSHSLINRRFSGNRSSSRIKDRSIVPVNFLLKYDPPRIGIKYVDPDKPGKYKVKKITLAHLKKEGADADRVVDDLFRCHSKYFNKKHTKKEQVKELVEKMIAYHRKQRSTKMVHALLESETAPRAPLRSSRIPKAHNTPKQCNSEIMAYGQEEDEDSKRSRDKSRSLNKLREAIRCGASDKNSFNKSYNGKRRQKLESKGIITYKEAIKMREKVGTKITNKEIELLRGRIYRELKFMSKFRSRKEKAENKKEDQFNTTSTEESESVSSDQNMKSFTDSKICSNRRVTHFGLKKLALNLTSKFKPRKIRTSIDTKNPVDEAKFAKVKKFKKSDIIYIIPGKTRTRTSQEL